MDDKIKKFLYDIEVAINEIESFVQERRFKKNSRYQKLYYPCI